MPSAPCSPRAWPFWVLSLASLSLLHGCCASPMKQVSVDDIHEDAQMSVYWGHPGEPLPEAGTPIAVELHLGTFKDRCVSVTQKTQVELNGKPMALKAPGRRDYDGMIDHAYNGQTGCIPAVYSATMPETAVPFTITAKSKGHSVSIEMLHPRQAPRRIEPSGSQLRSNQAVIAETPTPPDRCTLSLYPGRLDQKQVIALAGQGKGFHLSNHDIKTTRFRLELPSEARTIPKGPVTLTITCDTPAVIRCTAKDCNNRLLPLELLEHVDFAP